MSIALDPEPGLEPEPSHAVPERGRSSFLRRALRHKSVVAGGGVLILLGCAALFAPLISPHDPFATNPATALEPPGGAFWFGTDQFGRDILSRIIYGARLSLPMGLIPVSIAATIGVAVGVLIGYHRGWLDSAFMRLIDVAFAFPPILLALAAVAILGPGFRNIMVALGIAWTPYYIRMARGQAIQAKEHGYVVAAVSAGASGTRVLRRHILQSVFAPVLVMMSIGVANAILAGAALSFLGLGAAPPTPEWGTILNDGKAFIERAWWIGFFPGVAIAVTVLASNLLGDGLRDILDPRLQSE